MPANGIHQMPPLRKNKGTSQTSKVGTNEVIQKDSILSIWRRRTYRGLIGLLLDNGIKRFLDEGHDENLRICRDHEVSIFEGTSKHSYKETNIRYEEDCHIYRSWRFSGKRSADLPRRRGNMGYD